MKILRKLLHWRLYEGPLIWRWILECLALATSGCLTLVISALIDDTSGRGFVAKILDRRFSFLLGSLTILFIELWRYQRVRAKRQLLPEA
jgi:hypothetical protein